MDNRTEFLVRSRTTDWTTWTWSLSEFGITWTQQTPFFVCSYRGRWTPWISSLVLHAFNNPRELRQMTLEESRSTLNWMSPTCRREALSWWARRCAAWCPHSSDVCVDKPRDNANKRLRGCLINAKGLVFEDLATPGEMSRRDFCLWPNYQLRCCWGKSASLHLLMVHRRCCWKHWIPVC